MKTFRTFIGILAAVLLLASCDSGSMMTRATGMAYEIVVVMDKSQYEGDAGEAIKDELLAAIPGLPQREPAFRITAVSPREFSGMFTYVRNILLVNIDPQMYTRVSVNTENNRWASGQVVMSLNSPDAESLIEWLKGHPRNITNYFTKVEIDRTQNQLESNYSTVVLDNLKAVFDISLRVPSDMKSTKNGTDFFWASNNAKSGRTDLLVYTFPYTDPETFTAEYMIHKRDSVLEANVPGEFPNSYMTTEKLLSADYTPISVRGKYVGELRGLWKMVGDMMGGPFVSHARLDEVNNRVVVVEGFVFAPETANRNFIRRIEGALYTLRLPGDTE